jgi:hypothetical protein
MTMSGATMKTPNQIAPGKMERIAGTPDRLQLFDAVFIV